MKKLIAAFAVATLTACDPGQAPELYAIIIDFFRPATTCYTSGMLPATAVTASSPASVRVEVYDGAEQKSFLEIVEGARNVDMGDAPDVALAGLMEGTSSQNSFTFGLNRTIESTSMAGGVSLTLTDTSKATVTFQRGQTIKGTMSVSSSRTCAGTACGATGSPSCTIDNIAIRGTRLQVDYQTAP